MQIITKIDIPEPCSQAWDNMTPNTSGRHCASCNKMVIDFTSMTDAEIISYLITQQHVCGRIDQFQLNAINHRLSIGHDKAAWWKRMAIACSIVAIFSATKSEAQVKAQQHQSASKKSVRKIVEPLTARQDTVKPKFISGRVVDNNEKGVPGVELRLLHDTFIESFTDTAGYYKFLVPVKSGNSNLVEVSLGGEVCSHFPINSKTIENNIIWLPEKRYEILGGAVAISRPAPFYIRWYYGVKRAVKMVF